jgi:hypothetical protein
MNRFWHMASFSGMFLTYVVGALMLAGSAVILIQLLIQAFHNV